MATELTIHTWCDACLSEDARSVATTYTVALGGKDARTLDLCDKHHETLLAPLVEAVSVWGADPAKAPPMLPQAEPQRPRVACLVCGDMLLGSAMAGHLRHMHQTTLADIYGATCPLCGHTFERMASLGVHVTKGHGVPGVAEAFGVARKDGDPHGAVAARLALVPAT